MLFHFFQSLDKQLVDDGTKVQDIEDKVNKMEDAGVLPRDGFAGTLNDRCNEVRKEQQKVNASMEEAKPKYVRKIFFTINISLLLGSSITSKLFSLEV